MKNAINAGIEAVPASGFLDRIVITQRRKLFDAFMAFKQGINDDSVLSVSIMPTSLFDKRDYLTAWSEVQQRGRITSYDMEAPAIQPSSTGRQKFKEMRLPFADGEFDWVACNEVIEHAGGFERQLALVRELYRVARKGIFVTTTNRHHPIEFNTGLPLIHLLPAPWWRRLLRWTGKGKWASAEVLNPVDSATLYRIANLLPGSPAHDVGHKRVWGVKAYFFLMVGKAD